jgi:hypothetical protein
MSDFTIIYAYGASGVTGEFARKYFEINLGQAFNRSFAWDIIDWRESIMKGPDQAQFDLLETRFQHTGWDSDKFDFDDVQLVAAVSPQYLTTEASEATINLAETVAVRDYVDNGQWSSSFAVTDGIEFLVNRRKFMRDIYVDVGKKVGTTLADIMNYLAGRNTYRAKIVESLRAKIDDATSPVVLIGESLGGIMLVDAMSSIKESGQANPIDAKRCSSVALLVTFASQSAALKQIASSSADPAPEPFAPWLNIWQPDDFLSYPIEESFEELNRGRASQDGKVAIDRVAQHRSLFPTNHSSYMTDLQSHLYEFIDETLADIPSISN